MGKLTPFVVLLVTACGSTRDISPSSQPPSKSGSRAIREADIVQIHNGRLYALSRMGSASVVDVSWPGRLELLGQAQLPGEPFEMYMRNGHLITMSNDAVSPAGVEYEVGTQDRDPGAGALVTVLDVRDPKAMRRTASFQVPGEVADSRLIGKVLYLATYENSRCFGCGAKSRTVVSTFDVSQPGTLVPVDQVVFESTAPDSYNAQWGQHWKRSIVANDTRMYVAGHGDIDPTTRGTDEGIIDVLDISDRSGRLVRGARIVVAGALLSRWQMDENNGILRVVSQRGAGRTAVGLEAPEVATFRIDSTQQFTPLGTMTMRLPRPEGLRAVAFDGTRAYAITYARTDPLFVIDLANPAQPRQRGELVMPGFMYHLVPQGNRIIGLGVDRIDSQGSLNVSLFDVSNADQPRMLSRASFGTPYIGDDAAILNEQLTEDQDRIQKAFRILPSGLVVVPFNELRSYGYESSCENVGGGVQLVQWSEDTLAKRALLPLPGNPRRALERNGELVTLSDSNVRTFSLARTDLAMQTADLVIDTCVPFYDDDEDWNTGGSDTWEDDQVHVGHCSAGGGSSWLAIFGVLGLVLRRRRMM